MRGATTSRTAEMCQPATASTTPPEIRASTSVATCSGGAPPSTSTRRTSLPSTPDAALTSSAASWAQHSQEGPKMPAGPWSGITRATSSASRARFAGAPSRTDAFSIIGAHPSHCLLREYFTAIRKGLYRGTTPPVDHDDSGRAMTTTNPAAVADLDLARALTLVERSVVLRLGEARKAEGGTLEEWRVLSFLGGGEGHA